MRNPPHISARPKEGQGGSQRRTRSGQTIAGPDGEQQARSHPPRAFSGGQTVAEPRDRSREQAHEAVCSQRKPEEVMSARGVSQCRHMPCSRMVSVVYHGMWPRIPAPMHEGRGRGSDADCSHGLLLRHGFEHASAMLEVLPHRSHGSPSRPEQGGHARIGAARRERHRQPRAYACRCQGRLSLPRRHSCTGSRRRGRTPQ